MIEGGRRERDDDDEREGRNRERERERDRNRNKRRGDRAGVLLFAHKGTDSHWDKRGIVLFRGSWSLPKI